MQCPYCREEIIDGARVCRFCGRDQPPTARQKKAAKAKTNKALLIGIPCGILALILLAGIGTMMHASDVESRLRRCAEIAPTGLTPDAMVALADSTAEKAGMSMTQSEEAMGRFACPRLFP